ncbi:pentapeptide repeat-containing protein [Streptomyces sp. NPDC020490]|uniref:pentapeptide repeat-containing protein n=1 Tax=Streptomyces sp. NPDC020490 TaxID=3365078 RepID=UPI0037B79EE3
MSARLPRRRTQQRGLRLWPVGPVLALTFTVAVLVAAGVFYTGWELLGVRGLKPEHRIDSKTLFDLVKLSFGVVAGAGALVALVVAYRRQRVDEDGALREATRLHTERFTTAVGQLGEESAAVRLGAVHALAGLADDAPDDSLRQTCVDVLCAYLQLPFTPDPGDDPAHQEEHHQYLAFRKVRHTILRLIGDHYRRPQGTHRSWQGCDLDLTGVTIDGDMDFEGARFSGGRVSFTDVTFAGGRVSFDRAVFSGGTVSFGHAVFSGGRVSFRGAVFSGGTVSFRGAVFSGSTVSFYGAVFSGDAVLFDRATFSYGDVSFGDAGFSGGRVSFNDATFAGGAVSFLGATFSRGMASFRRATFSSGVVFFDRVTFAGGTVSFVSATFSSDAVSFRSVRFFGDGEVSFTDARGRAPSGLLDAVGTASGPVVLPSTWLPLNP